MRLIASFFGLVAIVFGLVMFVRLGASERELAAKVQRIHEGKIQAEALTVVRKYINTTRRGGSYPHVVLSSRNDPRINLSTTPEFYDSVNTNSTVTGYHFADGYFVPSSIGGEASVARWVFLGVGLVVGVGFLAIGLTSGRTESAEGDSYHKNPSLRDLLTVVRNRGRKE